MWLFTILGFAVVTLAHILPFPFFLDAMAGDSAVWEMPPRPTPSVYLTFDDGPNPSTTPQLLDVLARERARATFFLIDEHITEATAAIVRRMFVDGHAVALHSGHRWLMLQSAEAVARRLDAVADRIELAAGRRPCRAFRPHAGWRSGEMYEGLKRIDYRMIGWGWMLWDWNWLRRRTAEASFDRIYDRASDGDIIVLHDGDESAPLRLQQHTIDAAARLIPALRERGFTFATVCENGG